MTLRLVPEGATIERTYLAIPGHYGIGREFANTDEGWDAAVLAARAKKADLVSSLTASLGTYSTPEEVERTADVQVRIDLRWSIRYPQGGGLDTTVESFKSIDRLRTNAEIRSMSPDAKRALA